jgi:hypothetical protein
LKGKRKAARFVLTKVYFLLDTFAHFPNFNGLCFFGHHHHSLDNPCGTCDKRVVVEPEHNQKQNGSSATTTTTTFLFGLIGREKEKIR